MPQKKRRTPSPREVEIYRNDVRIRYYPTNTKPPIDATRGEISELTQSSLKRLAFIANNTMVDLDVMVTLTYPKIFPTSGRELKRHLDNMLKFFRRRITPFSYLWFLEFQKRGAPHYHLMYCSRGEIVDKADVGRQWARICDTGDPYHESVGTRIEKIRTANGAGRYAAKYASKAEQKTIPEPFRDIGRFWGTSRDVPPKPLVRRRVSGIYEVSGILDGWQHAKRAVLSGYGICYNAAAQACENMGLPEPATPAQAAQDK